MFSGLGCFPREHPGKVQLGRGRVTAMQTWRLRVSPAFSSSPALPARPAAEQKESLWARRRREPRGDENLPAVQSPVLRQPRPGGSHTPLSRTEARESPHPLVMLNFTHSRVCTHTFIPVAHAHLFARRSGVHTPWNTRTWLAPYRTRGAVFGTHSPVHAHTHTHTHTLSAGTHGHAWPSH